jgi:hypothetical protein
VVTDSFTSFGIVSPLLCALDALIVSSAYRGRVYGLSTIIWMDLRDFGWCPGWLQCCMETNFLSGGSEKECENTNSRSRLRWRSSIWKVMGAPDSRILCRRGGRAETVGRGTGLGSARLIMHRVFVGFHSGESFQGVSCLP